MVDGGWWMVKTDWLLVVVSSERVMEPTEGLQPVSGL